MHSFQTSRRRLLQGALAGSAILTLPTRLRARTKLSKLAFYGPPAATISDACACGVDRRIRRYC